MCWIELGSLDHKADSSPTELAGPGNTIFYFAYVQYIKKKLYLSVTWAIAVDSMINCTKRKTDWIIPTTIADIGKREVSFEGSSDLLTIDLKDDTGTESRVLRMSRTSLKSQKSKKNNENTKCLMAARKLLEKHIKTYSRLAPSSFIDRVQNLFEHYYFGSNCKRPKRFP